MHLSIRTRLRAQDIATKRTSLHSDPASSPRHRQQIVHLSIRTPLRAQDTGNKSCILALRPRYVPKTPATNKSCILAFDPRIELKTPARNRTSLHSDPASSPRNWQQIVHLSIESPLRSEDTATNLYILAFGPLFELEILATKRTS